MASAIHPPGMNVILGDMKTIHQNGLFSRLWQAPCWNLYWPAFGSRARNVADEILGSALFMIIRRLHRDGSAQKPDHETSGFPRFYASWHARTYRLKSPVVLPDALSIQD